MESIDRTQKRKRDKQPTVSGVVVLLLVKGKEKRLLTVVKWDLTVLHEKIYKETNENLEVKLILHILLCKI
ncbi:hypothetical protein D8674_017393 [Pyrus ussuriensis x Pyrus communis]|uniref:Uncharacterized protein n=1 Tax=Pyrus ussuriensis x Pyrus communis TaxID=2448454 RepID=A0A5N5HGK9_9ROSA|nr:hypothetical protein D8674_017393 [Pyrus ussuriensis x Pyrus communis]